MTARRAAVLVRNPRPAARAARGATTRGAAPRATPLARESDPPCADDDGGGGGGGLIAAGFLGRPRGGATTALGVGLGLGAGLGFSALGAGAGLGARAGLGAGAGLGDLTACFLGAGAGSSVLNNLAFRSSVSALSGLGAGADLGAGFGAGAGLGGLEAFFLGAGSSVPNNLASRSSKEYNEVDVVAPCCTTHRGAIGTKAVAEGTAMAANRTQLLNFIAQVFCRM